MARNERLVRMEEPSTDGQQRRANLVHHAQIGASLGITLREASNNGGQTSGRLWPAGLTLDTCELARGQLRSALTSSRFLVTAIVGGLF